MPVSVWHDGTRGRLRTRFERSTDYGDRTFLVFDEISTGREWVHALSGQGVSIFESYGWTRRQVQHMVWAREKGRLPLRYPLLPVDAQEETCA
jgi:hypothetical protein